MTTRALCLARATQTRSKRRTGDKRNTRNAAVCGNKRTESASRKRREKQEKKKARRVVESGKDMHRSPDRCKKESKLNGTEVQSVACGLVGGTGNERIVNARGRKRCEGRK
ncbi:hypothetical protein TRVL_01291 [Trypanosoma vivax]|nr:hypothetical protein TRVL_01291 [Trypanosoma vivax]